MDKKVKLIGIDKEGVLKVDFLSSMINKDIIIDKIFPSQDVDKDYVRELLDGVEVLFLFYDINNKRAIQIANAIDYMANERKIVSIGVNISDDFDENKKSELGIEFAYTDKLLNIINMISKYDTENSIISIDITDIREIFSKDSDIFYDYVELNQDEFDLNILEKIDFFKDINEANSSNEKQIIFFETYDNTFNLESIYDIVSFSSSKGYESIFMLSNSSDKNILKIGIIRN